MQIIDLTHTFIDNMPVYPGDPAVTLKSVAELATSGYNDHELKSFMHVGTHMDAPLHMIADGKHMDEIALERFMGQGVLLDVRGRQKIDATAFDGVSVKPDSIVLLYTGFESKYHSDSYYDNYPAVTEDFAQKAVDLQVKIVGMDILGPDQPPFPTHKILLGNEVLIIENLCNLHMLLGVPKFEVMALPMKLHADAAPVRVMAIVKM